MDQFAAEVGNRATTASEQLLALKFLSQLVGDLHRPLHAADDHDAAGNKKLAKYCNRAGADAITRCASPLLYERSVL
jgi:hypothetical protein